MKRILFLLCILALIGVIGCRGANEGSATPVAAPTATVVYASPTPAPTATSAFIVFADNAVVSRELLNDPNLFVELSTQEVLVLIGDHGSVGPGFGEYSSAAASISALDIPLTEGFAHPCSSGTHRSSAPFNQPRSYGLHKGKDLVCTNGAGLQAVSKSIVWRVYQNLGYDSTLGAENNYTFDFDVSGRTYVLVTRVPKEYFPEAVNEPGDTVVVIILYGHMENPSGGEPGAGSILDAGSWIGNMGWTGHVKPEGPGGTHLHLGTGLVLSDGRIVMFDPARLLPGLEG